MSRTFRWTSVPFPWCTNRAQVGTDLAVDAEFGWLYLNLNGGDANDELYRQAHVTTVMDADGRFSVGFDAVAFNQLSLTTDDRGPRNPDATLGPTYKGLNTPTLFTGGFVP
jgi:hypothetical protein